jgi:hypothetical protein
LEELSLVEQIGVDPRDFEWQQLAACKGYPANIFFEDYEAGDHIAIATDELCGSCPVAKECYALGVKTKSTGVFGGFYLNNGKPSKTKNAHKTIEVATALAKKVFADG